MPEFQDPQQAGGNNNVDRYRERITNFSKEFELGLFIRIAKSNIIWISLITLACLLLSVIYIRYTQPIFQSSLVLQIGKDEGAKKILGMDFISDETNIDSKIELLRSPFIFRQAIKKMPLNTSYFYEGNLLAEEQYIHSAYKLKDLVIFDSTVCDNRIDIVFTEKEFNLNYTLSGQSFQFEGQHNSTITTPHFKAYLEVSNIEGIFFTQAENKFYFILNNKITIANKLYASLLIKLVNVNAQTVEISFQYPNPYLAKDVVEAVADSYNEFDSIKKSESAYNILNYINSQIKFVSDSLKDSERKLSEFHEANNIQDFQGLSINMLERITKQEELITEEFINLNTLNQIEKDLNKNIQEKDLNAIMAIIINFNQETGLVDLLKELRTQLQERKLSLYSNTEKNKTIKEIDYRINNQIEIIRLSLSNLKTQTKEKLDKYYKKKREYDSIYFDIPKKEIINARLQLRKNINEKFYTLLVEKRTEYSISQAGYTSKNQILYPAVLNLQPVSPNKKLVYFSFILLGIILSGGLILVKYLLHDQISSLNEIIKQSHASIGVLGIIPKFKNNIPVSQLIIDKNPKSLISEAFRTIRTNLQFIDNSPGVKLVAVTSTISGEGKTFVAINLAGIISLSGKKVVILDLDMRKPKIHIGFSSDNDKGMSTLLIGRDSLDDCLRNSSLENLKFVTAGPIPPNPSELILNGKIDAIIEELKTKFDVIIFDLPPVGLVTDGIPLIQRCDYPLYIFRSNYSKKNFVQNADRLINENHINRLSVILNGVDTQKASYGYNYGYGYGYGYGYSYGENYYSEEDNDKKSFFNRIFRRRNKK